MLLIKHIQERAKTVTGVTIAVDLAYLGGILKTAKELWRMPVDITVVANARASLRYMGLSSKSKECDRRPTMKEIDDICLHFNAKLKQRVPMADLIHFAIESAM